MDCQYLTPTFQGCVRLIVINGQPMNLSYVQQRLLGNYNELKFDTCQIRDRYGAVFNLFILFIYYRSRRALPVKFNNGNVPNIKIFKITHPLAAGSNSCPHW